MTSTDPTPSLPALSASRECIASSAGNDLTVAVRLPAGAVDAAVRGAERALEHGLELSQAYDIAAEVVCQHLEITVAGGRRA
jgi:hypothetical protein